MDYTKNYNLKKPSNEDFYNVEDFNSNVETVDTELKKVNDKADKIEKQQINKIELEEILSSQNILKKIKEVDGAGSGLDADTVDGLNTGYHPNNTFIPNVYGSVLEIGKYIDFHEPGSNKDFDGRLSLNNKYPYWQPDSGAVSRVALADGTLQTNLNAALLDGKNSSYFSKAGFGNGGEFSRQLTGDCLNVKDGGIYVNQIFTGLNMQNAPSTGQWYHYQQYVITDKYVVLIAIPATEGNPYIRRKVEGIWGEWKEMGGGNLFTIPRKFEVVNAIAGQTIFSYSGGAGKLQAIWSPGTLICIIDGIELGYWNFPQSSSTYDIRLTFKNSLVIKSRALTSNILGLVTTEK